MLALSSQLVDIIQKWSHYLKVIKSYSAHTLDAYVTDLFYFIKFLNEYMQEKIELNTLEHLTLKEIRAWLAKRQNDRLKTTSNNRAISVLRSFYRFLHKQYNIENQEIFLIKIPNKNKPLPRTLTIDNAKFATENIAELSDIEWVSWRDISILFFLYGAGLRIGEVLSLTYNDIKSIKSNTLIVRGKGNKERAVPILPETIEAVGQYIKFVPYDLEEGALFRGIRGKALNPDVYRYQIRKLRGLFGLPEHTSPHAFRHSFATHLLGKGGSLRAIQELLGHAKLSTTQRYTKLNSEQLLSDYKKFHPMCKK